MQILPAIAMAFSAISRAPSFVFSISAVAAAMANGPPEPIAAMSFVGLDHVAIAADDVGVVGVGHQQQRFQVAQHAVGAPVLRQLHHGARQIAVELFELGFEAREQREGVGGGAGEPGQNLVVVEPAELSWRRLSALPGRGSPGRRRPSRLCRRGGRRGSSSSVFVFHV